jgi:hypothetical protein
LLIEITKSLFTYFTILHFNVVYDIHRWSHRIAIQLKSRSQMSRIKIIYKINKFSVFLHCYRNFQFDILQVRDSLSVGLWFLSMAQTVPSRRRPFFRVQIPYFDFAILFISSQPPTASDWFELFQWLRSATFLKCVLLVGFEWLHCCNLTSVLLVFAL